MSPPSVRGELVEPQKTRMTSVITQHIDLWTSAIKRKSTAGRGSSSKVELYGIKKLRELILELAVRGLLVPQDPNDEPAGELLKRIAAEKAKLVKEGKIKKDKLLPAINDGDHPFDLPQGWVWARLGGIGTVASSSRVHQKDWQASGVPFYRTREIVLLSQHGFVDNELFISEELYKSFEKNGIVPEAGDLMFTGVGTIGVPYVVADSDKFYFKDASVLIFKNHFRIYPRFLSCFMRSPCWINAIHEDSMGTTVHTLTIVRANNVPVPLPPLAEQHRIVAKVDELMALCDQLEQQTDASLSAHQTLVQTLLNALTSAPVRPVTAMDGGNTGNAGAFSGNPVEGQRASMDRQAHHSARTAFDDAWQRIAEHFDTLFTTEDSIDQLKQTILQLAVMGKLVPQDPNDEPASELLKKIAAEKVRLEETEGLRTSADATLKDADKYLLTPGSWGWIRIGNLAKFVDYRGRTPEKIESGVRLITAKNIRYGYIDSDPEEFISSEDYDSWMTRGFPRKGDTLFTTEAPLGNAANIALQEKFALAQRTICFQWHEPNIGPFMLLQILAKPFQDKLIDNATGMTATGIKASKLKEIPVALPPLAEQHRIVAKVGELMARCDQLKARLSDAQATQLHLADAITERALE